ncbi:MAG: helix-hairpin-helix domain-containing protein [Sedimentisphaerales bacterium]
MRQKTEDRSLPAEVTTKAGQKTERFRRGSAIILAVVLTTLLAIIGVLFLFSSRVDSVATSAVGDNHDLKLAVDTVVARISEVLTNNVPRVDANGIYYGTYYNYPDTNNPWLACLEPYQSGSNYFWQQVSNIYGSSVFQNVQALPLPEYQPVVTPYNTLADADGDGVSDSMWVQISDVNSSKGKPIYAAIRIIDNGAMLNLNTGYWFDANADPNYTNGSSQTQINLLALANRPFYTLTQADIQARADYLNNYRCGSGPNDITDYANNVVWQYGLPLSANGTYTPFDISDELELRYRFLINQTGIDTRSEAMKNWEIGRKYDFQTPISSASDLNEWFRSSNSDYVLTDPNYEYRHIATTYNMDRIIAPDGNKMVNVNFTDIVSLRNRIQQVLDPNVYDANQIAVNLIDYIDTDSNVTYFQDPSTGHNYYGFEQPCIYISQIAENFYQSVDVHGAITATYHSYAIELFKPNTGDPLPDANWQLVVGGNSPISISWSPNSYFLVIRYRDPTGNAPLDINNVNTVVDDNIPGVSFVAGDTIVLKREVTVNGSPFFLPVDEVNVPAADSATGWLIDSNDNSSPHSIQRDITLNKCIRKLWSGILPPELGGSVSSRYVSFDTDMIQAHPTNKPFTNIGEIGQLFRTDANMIGPGDTEASVRLNIADPCVQNLFKYLTVIDPAPGDPNQTRIKGRININTAPWYVLAQLPWVSYHTQPNYNLAQAIVSNRDTYGAFKSTGELMRVGIGNNDVNSIGYYQGKAVIPPGLLTPTDCNLDTGDAFEERDVIFDRISNLITVRSDVFTAYILVRIGQNGPQKRVIAIFDRSEVPAKKVKIVAIQSVPDPR